MAGADAVRAFAAYRHAPEGAAVCRDDRPLASGGQGAVRPARRSRTEEGRGVQACRRGEGAARRLRGVVEEHLDALRRVLRDRPGRGRGGPDDADLSRLARRSRAGLSGGGQEAAEGERLLGRGGGEGGNVSLHAPPPAAGGEVCLEGREGARAGRRRRGERGGERRLDRGRVGNGPEGGQDALADVAGGEGRRG